MLINSKDHRSKTGPIIVAIIVIFALLGFQLVTSSKNSSVSSLLSEKEKKTSSQDAIELSSQLYTDMLLDSEENKIFKRDNFSLYLNQELGSPTLMAVYADSISELEKNGRFLAFLYLNDPSNWRKANKKFDHIMLVKESLRPIRKVLNGKEFYFFKFRLEHPYFDIDNLERLEFVRHSRAFGRFEEVVISADSLKVLNTISNSLEDLTISINQKRLDKVAAKRAEALESGVLMTSEDDFVKAKVSSGDKQDIAVSMRLKGDWTDHLEHPSKWSYRIVPNGEETLFGMRKFSVQHPKARNYLWEWLFNKVVKDNDLIGLRYDFLNVKMHIAERDSLIDMGIMALEESFDKILIENNKKREGLILGFDETAIWNERKQSRDLGLDLQEDMTTFKAAELPVKVYNENKTLSSPVLARQFEIARNLLLGLRDGKLKLSEAFDVDKLTMYIALSNLFGGHHGLHIENVRIYYNPVTNKLEPVSFDSNSGNNIRLLREYPVGIPDDVFREKLVEKYALVSSEAFISNFISKYESPLNDLGLNLIGEFNEAGLDYDILQHNANFIKKKIFPANSIDATLISYDHYSLEIEVKNYSEFPMVIQDLVLSNKKSLNKKSNLLPIPAKETVLLKFNLKDAFNNAFVSKKNKEGGFRYPKDLKKIQLAHHLLGSPIMRYQPIKAFSSAFDMEIVASSSLGANLNKFDFIRIDEANKNLHFTPGNHELKELLYIPEGYIIQVPEGFSLNLSNGATLISYSALHCNGSSTSPIHFYSEDSSGGGIFVSSSSTPSIIKNTRFTNLSIPKVAHWELSGSVNFNETVVRVENSTFEKNRSEDALNIIRSEFSIDSVQFKDTYSDAFDGDFVKGKISNSVFSNSGNDGIDVSGSEVVVENVLIINPSDKALSAGEGSTIQGKNIDIKSGEIGLVSKDLSRIDITGIRISDTRLAISCFQKKTEYGPGLIDLKDVSFSGIEVAYLIEPNSDLIIDNKVIQEKTEGVIDKMYGSEYGKSSR